jgi:hypothetical protein
VSVSGIASAGSASGVALRTDGDGPAQPLAKPAIHTVAKTRIVRISPYPARQHARDMLRPRFGEPAEFKVKITTLFSIAG